MYDSDRRAEVYYYGDEPPIQTAMGTHFNVGLDLATKEDITINGDDRYVEIDFGVVLEPPPGYWLMMVARSSTYKKWGLVQANGVGIIDPAYCGPKDTVKGLFLNDWDMTRTIPKGTRLVQIISIPQKLAIVVHNPVNPNSTNRGGVGSTG